jgi:hypothetical protein
LCDIQIGDETLESEGEWGHFVGDEEFSLLSGFALHLEVVDFWFDHHWRREDVQSVVSYFLVFDEES